MSNVMNRKMFRSRNARNKLNQMGGIMASSPELMGAVQRFANGSGPGGVRPHIYSNVSPGNMFRSIMDFLGTGNAQSGVGQIQDINAMKRAGITPADLQRVQSRTPPGPTIAQKKAAAQTRSQDIMNSVEEAQQLPVPEGGLGSAITNIENQLSDLGGLMTDAQKAGSEARLDVLEQAEQERTEQAKETIDVEPYFETPKQEPTVKDDIESKATEAANLATSKNVDDQTSAKAITDVAKEILSRQDASAEELNKAFTDLVGATDADKKETRDERIKANVELYKRLFKEDPKDIKTENGFNLAFMGFAIAAGDSPDALANIAKGAMQGAEKFQNSAKERKKRADRAKMFELETTLKTDAELRANEQKMAELKFGLSSDVIKQRFATDADLAKWSAAQTLAESRFDKEMTQRLKIANAKETGETERATLLREVQSLNAVRDNLPKAYNMWLELNPDFEASDLKNNPELLERVQKETRQIALDLRTTGAGGKTPDPGKTVEYEAREAFKDSNTRDYIAQDLGVLDAQGNPDGTKLSFAQILQFYKDQEQPSIDL